MNRVIGIRARLAEEQGQALVLAIAIVVIGLLLGLGAVAYGLSVSGKGAHDERTRGAQQAADSGTQQQLYLNSDSDSVGYNLNGGALGLGTFLACTVPELTAGVQVGDIQVAAGSSGICPSSCVSTSTCSPPTPSTGTWTALDNEDYYEAQFYPNTEEQGGNASPSSDAVEFPDIVSIGCHTTATTGQKASCNSGAAGNSYSRQLSVLEPTGPLQSLEATNDVTVNSSLNLLNQLLEADDVSCSTQTLLGIRATVCSVNNSDGLLGVLAATVQGLVGTACDVLGVLLTGSNQSCVISQLVSTVDSVASIAIIDGNISAGNSLYLPNTSVNVNTSTGTLSTLGNIAGTVTSLLGTLANPTSLFSAFDYQGYVCPDSAVSTGTSSTDTSKCGTPNGSGGTTSPVVSIAPTYVHAANTCKAGQPQSSCTVVRPSFGLTTQPVGGSALPTGITYTGPVTPTYSNGTIKITGDTSTSPGKLTFAGGRSYVLCGLYADQNVSVGLATGSTSAAQIYIAAPGTLGCSSSDGNFIACGGIANPLTSGGLNLPLNPGLTNVLNPAGIQIYVQGSKTTAGGGSLSAPTKDVPVSTSGCQWSASGSGSYTPGLDTADPATQVVIGNGASGLASSATSQAFIVYAPRSEVTINSATAFEGSAIGFNVDITALAILQDLDIGTYPLSPVVNAYQVAQTLQCDNSVQALSYTESGNPRANYGSPRVTASGNAGDLDGCTG